MLLIRLLCAPAYNCFGVGDDDQVIYGYAGATPEYLINFGDYFPGRRPMPSRSTTAVRQRSSAAATHVLSYNRPAIDKTITTPPTHRRPPRLRGRSAARGPVAVVAARSAELPLRRRGRVSAWVTAVSRRRDRRAARVNSTLLPIQVALSEAGIPCNAPLNARCWNERASATALAYLRMGLFPGSIRREDVRRRSGDHLAGSLRTCSQHADRAGDDIGQGHPAPGWPAVRTRRTQAFRLCGRPSMPSPDACRTSTRPQCGPSGPTSAWARRWTSGLIPAGGGPVDPRRRSLRARVVGGPAPRRGHVRGLAAGGPGAGRRADPAVHLSTIHKIKGREWEHVIVYGASEASSPSAERGRGRGTSRVPRRPDSSDAPGRGSGRCAEPSPFLAELNGSRAHTSVVRRRRDGRDSAGLSGGRSTTLTGGLRSQSEQRRRGPRTCQARQRRTSPVVTAEIGLVLEHGGHSGTVVDLTESAAIVEVGALDSECPSARRCGCRPPPCTSSRRQRVLRPRGPTRSWSTPSGRGAPKRRNMHRFRRSVVLNDAELAGIATSWPKTLAELSRCKGVGPIRLERWGDELLAVLEGADEVSGEAHVAKGIQR